MVKEKVWYVEIDRQWFEIKYYLENGRPCLTANGTPVYLQPRYNKSIDQFFTLNNKPVRLVVYDNKADIAVDGVFEENYDPDPTSTSHGIHWWSLIFAAASLSIMLFARGYIPAFIAGGAAGGCIGVYKLRSGTAGKVLLSIVFTAVGWGLVIGLLHLMYPTV